MAAGVAVAAGVADTDKGVEKHHARRQDKAEFVEKAEFMVDK